MKIREVFSGWSRLLLVRVERHDQPGKYTRDNHRRQL